MRTEQTGNAGIGHHYLSPATVASAQALGTERGGTSIPQGIQAAAMAQSAERQDYSVVLDNPLPEGVDLIRESVMRLGIPYHCRPAL
jgi:hypothetical protein